MENFSRFRTHKKQWRMEVGVRELQRIGITGGKMLRMEELDESRTIEARGHR